jgi:hypothetical protein
MSNVHDHHMGRNVVTLETQHRRFAVDFPGWGADDYADYLLPIPELLFGEVIGVESHGSNPWTRYGVRFEDGTTAHGLVLGQDIEFYDDPA